MVSYNLEEICPQCLSALIWAWAHSAAPKVALIREEIKAVRDECKKTYPRHSDIDKRLDHIESLASEIMPESSSPFQLQSISVNSLIDKRIQELRQRREYTGIAFSADLDPSDPIVTANPVWFRRVLDILIDNAKEAMMESSGAQIRIGTSVDGRKVKVTVSDKGPGLSNHVRCRLFERPSLHKPGGRGRGAYIARILIDIYGGNISVDSTSPEGTTIAIWLPLTAREQLEESSHVG